MNTTTKNTTPALLTEATEAEVSEALLRHATRNYPGAALVEHEGVVPPVGPQHVTYRLGALEVEALGWSVNRVSGPATSGTSPTRNRTAP